MYIISNHADIAQLVEFALGKGEVMGSTPIVSSIQKVTFMINTTPEDWILFKQEFNAWRDRLSLNDWEIEHVARNLPSARAKAEWTIEAMAAKITFSKDWTGTQLSPYEISKTAFHECLELLLAELSGMAMERYSHDEVSRVTHAIIHRLETAFYQPLVDPNTVVNPSGNATQA